MYPESVSVERSDRERKREWIEQDRGSTRKDTIGPKYGQVTLTGIKRQTRCRLRSRTSVLTFFQQYSDLSLSLSTSQVLGYQPPEGVVANRQEEPPPHT
jgi:hypothetical protein